MNPASGPAPPEDLPDAVERHARSRPDAPALWATAAGRPPRAVSYAELSASARRFAGALDRLTPAGAIVPLFMGKSAACVGAMVGAVGAGRVFACLDRKLRPPQINAVLRQVEGTGGRPLALTDGPGLVTLAAGLEASSPIARAAWRVVDADQLVAPQWAAADKLRAAGVDVTPCGEEDARGGTFAAGNASRPACCLFTSGSTGAPKGVLVAAGDLYARATAEVSWFGLTPADVLLNILPFSFDVGLNQLAGALVAGCPLVLSDSWLAADLLRAVERFGVSGLSAVPAVWSDLLASGLAFDKAAHATLRFVTVSGGDLPADALERLAGAVGRAGIFKTYGQTETFRTTSLRPEEFAARPGSLGRPFAGARAYVVRDDGGPCLAGEEGEIVHTGLGTMLGYLGEDRDGRGEKKLRPNPFRGPHDSAPLAVFTGDFGFLDADGNLYLTGRRDAMVKVAGNRVYPRQVAEQLSAVAAASEVEVVAATRPDGQTRLYAFVVGPHAADGPVVRRLLAARLPSYMVPQEVIRLDAMPRTVNGKNDRMALIALADRALACPPGGGFNVAPASTPKEPTRVTE